MPDEEVGREDGRERREEYSSAVPTLVDGKEEDGVGSRVEEEKDVPIDVSEGGRNSFQLIGVVIQQPGDVSNNNSNSAKAIGDGTGDEKVAAAVAVPSDSKKEYLQRTENYDEVCRVCQQPTEEPLLDLGCGCRGELAKVHRTCIDIWFRSRGSNKCEICQQVAANIPSPDSLPGSNYWVWRVNPASRASGGGHRQWGCWNPLWVAFSIVIAGLLLDVIISVSLGVSALPVNIVIGVLIVLGLGTAFRLALECCHEWSLRRNFQTTEAAVNPGYPPTV